MPLQQPKSQVIGRVNKKMSSGIIITCLLLFFVDFVCFHELRYERQGTIETANAKSAYTPVSTLNRATIGPPAKRHPNGVSLVGRL